MSTRFQRTANKTLNEQHAKILKECLQRPENRHCADCRRKDPRWASWNLGIFICIRCSGTHRSMGTHISRVKSIDLDSWTPEQVENVRRWGNAKANVYWEANLPSNAKIPESNIDYWIRSKYEAKKWAQKGPIPDPDMLSDGFSAQQEKAASSAPTGSTQEKTVSPVQRSATPNPGVVGDKDNLKSSIMSLYNSSPQMGGGGLSPMPMGQGIYGMKNASQGNLPSQHLQSVANLSSLNNLSMSNSSTPNLSSSSQQRGAQNVIMPQGGQFFNVFASTTLNQQERGGNGADRASAGDDYAYYHSPDQRSINNVFCNFPPSETTITLAYQSPFNVQHGRSQQHREQNDKNARLDVIQLTYQEQYQPPGHSHEKKVDAFRIQHYEMVVTGRR
ncbi:159_t:CDS:2 [Paraglomus occultum]|uniref:159_t:CDS:1 n=1 Tax=Paraglomus occultum TaxID=144539 RepID=A0A9N9G8Q3_9GLOM|nr:159_t:CDS:2 [Paraglomus occultum]